MTRHRPTDTALKIRRYVAILVASFTAIVAFGGPATAQDLPESQNSFQELYHECREFIDTDPFTGEDGGARDHEASNFLDGALNQLGNTVASGTCNAISAVRHPGDALEAAASTAASAFWGDPIGDFVKSLLEGNAQALSLIMTMWIKESPFSGADFESSVAGVFNLTLWAQVLLFVVSLIIAGARMAVARNRGLGDGFEDVGQLVFNFILAGAALPAVIMSLHMATDLVSTQWLTDGLGGDPEAKINAVALIDEKTGLGPAAVLILVVFALLGALAQMLALVIREGLLVVVVGLLPLAAASFALSTGKQAFKSMIGFVVAALLFKPVATLLYLVAFWLSSGTEQPSMMEAVSSMLLLAAAGLVLPALMRVVAPAVSASVSGGSAAGIGAAAAGATGAVAGAAGAALGNAQQSLGSGASSSGSGGQSAANGAAYLGPHSAGGSSSPPAAGSSGPTPSAPSGGGAPAGGKSSSGTGPSSSGRVGGAVASAARGAGTVAGFAAAGVGAVATAAQTTARATQTTEQMIDGALAAHPTPHHYR
ncbi:MULTISPECIES: hypothetical protein [Dietzia]|uniref:hypothetical protein n=1 Tax=Dietzia TaxID=37914 RepID=UPI000B279157|nr:hypothetical protein [Dietzia cinnamea]MCT2062109.1 hypothetical protein [Dietzia cinnamea]MCT2235130.1 hypothetical protein [Dietzia cinnamea]